jgi:hypothetical protein
MLVVNLNQTLCISILSLWAKLACLSDTQPKPSSPAQHGLLSLYSQSGVTRLNHRDHGIHIETILVRWDTSMTFHLIEFNKFYTSFKNTIFCSFKTLKLLAFGWCQCYSICNAIAVNVCSFYVNMMVSIIDI